MGALILTLAAGGWTSCKPVPRTEVQPPPALETIEASSKILGVAIGSSMQEAREKLDPLRTPAVYTPDQKEKTNRRIYWKLKETEFDWIMAWANAEGKITRLRAVYRPDSAKPFRDIGNLRTAVSASAEAAKWNLRGADGSQFRLVVQGANQQALSVYMFALEPFAERTSPAEEEPEEEE